MAGWLGARQSVSNVAWQDFCNSKQVIDISSYFSCPLPSTALDANENENTERICSEWSELKEFLLFRARSMELIVGEMSIKYLLKSPIYYDSRNERMLPKINKFQIQRFFPMIIIFHYYSCINIGVGPRQHCCGSEVEMKCKSPKSWPTMQLDITEPTNQRTNILQQADNGTTNYAKLCVQAFKYSAIYANRRSWQYNTTQQNWTEQNRIPLQHSAVKTKAPEFIITSLETEARRSPFGRTNNGRGRKQSSV